MASSASSAPLAKRRRHEPSGALDFGGEFDRLVAALDGPGLYSLLKTSEERRNHPKGGKHPVAADLVRAFVAISREAALDLFCSALRQWCRGYIEAQDTAKWMVLPFMWLCSRPRSLAGDLDKACGAHKHQLKLVELFREQFQQLHRDRSKRDGCLVICCELLRLYYSLRQVSQCSFLLAAVAQAHGGQKPDWDALPRALSVTLCFLWGKHHVLEGNVVEADEKLGWALARCPPYAVGNRRLILTYLVPCRLRLGRFPGRELLKHPDFLRFAGLARAVADGDVRKFDREVDSQERVLVRAGTYLVVEKLRLLAYRNLCRRVYAKVAADLDRMGRREHRHKQDWRPYEIAFAWQDDFDKDETICILAQLIFIGAIRGYMSDEHEKIVFSKENPFPAPAIWSPKA